MRIRWILIFLAFVIGCGIVGVSLLSAATVFPSTAEGLPTTASSSSLPFSDRMFHPAKVASQKIQLYFMDEQQRGMERLHIATQRWQTAEKLMIQEQYDVAVATFIKGHQYVAESAVQVQNYDETDQLKVAVVAKLHEYRQYVEQAKPDLSDKQKEMLDQSLAENEALLIHLGSSL